MSKTREGYQPKTKHPFNMKIKSPPGGGTGILPPGYEGVEEIRAALGHGADERLWPPGLTLGQSVTRLVAILEEIRETDRIQAEEEVDRKYPDLRGPQR